MAMEGFNFSHDFQDLVLACLVRHSDKFTQFGSLLKPEYFAGVHATIAARCLLEHHAQYNRFPTWESLGQQVSDESAQLGESESQVSGTKSAFEYVQKIRDIDTADVEYVVDRVVAFARERATIEAIRESIQMIQDGKTPPEGFVKKFEAAAAVGKDMEDMGILLARDWSDVVDEVTSRNYGIKTGYTHFDSIWKNGWAPGWLITILAPPKRYKTALCINLALKMAGPADRHTVFYYPCEISQQLAAMRTVSMISGKSLDYMFENPEKFKSITRQVIGNVLEGHLVMKGYAAKTVTIADIRQHALRAAEQLQSKPKCIFIDYAETIRPSPSASKLPHWQQEASIYTDARALGYEFGCPVVMPDRCNKETVDSAVPSMKSFQGSFQKAGIVDIAIGACSTDTEYNQNILRLFVFLNRHGKAYQHFKAKVDPESMRIAITEDLPFDPDPENDPVVRRERNRADRGLAGIPAELI